MDTNNYNPCLQLIRCTNAKNSYAMTSKVSPIKYLLQAAFSLPKRNLIKAIENNQFSTWTGFTLRAVHKYLPYSSPATYKGHTKIQKQGILSVKNKIKESLESIKTEQDPHLSKETEKSNHIVAYHRTLNPNNGTIYVDFTEKSPIRSIEGNTAIFILYDWSSNTILVTPVKDLKYDLTVTAFK